MSLITSVLSRIFPSEIRRLINKANAYPRYTPAKISYDGLQLDVTDFLSVAWQLKEIMVDKELDFPSASQSPVIYDCGANVGVASIYFKKKYPGAIIKAFEPDPAVFACLQKNIAQNGIDGVQLFQKAVWRANEKLLFSAEGADGGSIVTGTGKKIEVEAVRLKDLLRSESKIDFLKIDIEGAEVDVIPDIKDELKKVQLLFLEYHSWAGSPQHLDLLCSTLSESGFRYYIRSINSQTTNPFTSKLPTAGMDMQLNIHAIR